MNISSLKKIQTTAGKMLQKGVMDKLQKTKQVEAKVKLTNTRFLGPQPYISQYLKQQAAR